MLIGEKDKDSTNVAGQNLEHQKILWEFTESSDKLGLENLAGPFSFFSHNESKALSKRGELCKVFLTLCGFARNYSEDLPGKLSNNSMRPGLF
jgi:hypothetical protein